MQEIDMKFTKGPWEARDVKGAGWEIYATVNIGKTAGGGVLQPIYHVGIQPMLFVNKDGGVTAKLSYEDWRQFPSVDFEKMQAANAHLIAAAPRLYTALKALYNAVDSCVELTPDVLMEAREALMQIEGD
jgi:hypothetical protein